MKVPKRLADPGSLFVAFWLLLILIYGPAYKAGWFTDFLDTVNLARTQSFSDFINRAGIINKSFYQLTQILLYGLIHLFGVSAVSWLLLFTGLHALNGVLAIRFFSRFLSLLNYNGSTAAILGVVFFLFNPVQAEVLIWRASFHYLTGLAIILLILNWTISWLHKPSSRLLLQILVLFLASTFTLEIFYLTPAFVCVILIALFWSKSIDYRLFIKGIKQIFLPLAGIWIVYWISFNVIHGQSIAHYDFNLQEAFSWQSAGPKLLRNLVHVWFAEYFFPGAIRSEFYSVAAGKAARYFLAIVILFTVLGGFIRFRKMRPVWKVVYTSWILSLISLTLILPFWLKDSLMFTNDRYYYVPSLFLLLLLAVSVVQIRQKILRYTIGGIYLVLCLLGTIHIVLKAREAGQVFFSMIDSFRWQDRSHVVFLNLPNNLDGIGIIPAGNPHYFNKHLFAFGKDTIKGKTYDAASYNLIDRENGAHVTVLDSMTLKVTLNQWGTWWWGRNHGLTSHENELYQLDLTDPGHEYIMKFKQRPRDMVVLYQVGISWKEVSFDKPGQEQW